MLIGRSMYPTFTKCCDRHARETTSGSDADGHPHESTNGRPEHSDCRLNPQPLPPMPPSAVPRLAEQLMQDRLRDEHPEPAPVWVR